MGTSSPSLIIRLPINNNALRWVIQTPNISHRGMRVQLDIPLRVRGSSPLLREPIIRAPSIPLHIRHIDLAAFHQLAPSQGARRLYTRSTQRGRNTQLPRNHCMGRGSNTPLGCRHNLPNRRRRIMRINHHHHPHPRTRLRRRDTHQTLMGLLTLLLISLRINNI